MSADRLIGAVLDAVAEAFADDRATVEPLLDDLAAARAHADHMRHSPAATDYGREQATAALDLAREDLLDVLELPEGTAP
ncbi:hypothetical protein ACFU99_08605 [Streptomyces sp. NPDC057654]|uniref:hypothetical protein n=1 Tax=Streptomyces sp. NPDC057654 TaxID=3346196 RepID=UPI0036B391C1